MNKISVPPSRICRASPLWDSKMVMLSNNKPLKAYQLALPSLMAEDLVLIQLLVAVRLWRGLLYVLGHIASSPVSMVHRVINVLFESSMSMPSLLGVLKSP